MFYIHIKLYLIVEVLIAIIIAQVSVFLNFNFKIFTFCYTLILSNIVMAS